MPIALIVEDEPEANRLLALLIQLRGYRTESAFSGDEALRIARDRRPDVVFLDLMLPDTNGYDVCRALKARRETNPIPVIMVTARLAEENRVQSFQVGASRFVAKPYTPDQIFDALSAAAAWRREIEVEAPEGQIVLDTRTSTGPYEQVSRLISLLLTRTALDEESVRRLGQAMVELSQAVIDWGHRHAIERVAMIDYAIRPDRLILTIRDCGAGWLHSDTLPHESGLGGLIARGRFEDIYESDDSSELVLTKRLPPSPAPEIDGQRDGGAS
ncbi:MAG: response regulator [Isosphaeraceae bacterium]|nr:response regulator [Isosphaeraceae bacterium]